MGAIAKDKDSEAAKLRTDEPAKGGTEKGSDKVHESEDSPKPHGDPMRHVNKSN